MVYVRLHDINSTQLYWMLALDTIVGCEIEIKVCKKTKNKTKKPPFTMSSVKTWLQQIENVGLSWRNTSWSLLATLELHQHICKPNVPLAINHSCPLFWITWWLSTWWFNFNKNDEFVRFHLKKRLLAFYISHIRTPCTRQMLCYWVTW